MTTDHHLDEQRASRLLHGATLDLAPDVDRLVQGGVARGRTLRRRRRVGTTLAAAAVVGILGAAAGVGSHLVAGGDAAPARDLYAASPSPSPSTPPPGASTTLPIDTLVVVSAEDAPAVIGELVPGGTVGQILRDPPFGVSDLRQDKTVFFLYDGTLTTFSIQRADSLATCAELIDPANQPDGQPGGACVEQDGVTLLRSGPETADGVTSQSVMAFVHGYVVSAVSTNAVDGKDVEPVTDQPPLSMDDLTTIVTSPVWFGEEG